MYRILLHEQGAKKKLNFYQNDLRCLEGRRFYLSLKFKLEVTKGVCCVRVCVKLYKMGNIQQFLTYKN